MITLNTPSGAAINFYKSNTVAADIACYLISPYTKDPERLFPKAVEATRLLIELGLSVYSPIIYGHTVVNLLFSQQPAPNFWDGINDFWLEHANTFAVLQCPELYKSDGCLSEIEALAKADVITEYIVVELAPIKQIHIFGTDKKSFLKHLGLEDLTNAR